jgi:DNA repair exonuclease SbcCD ATPase subunit
VQIDPLLEDFQESWTPYHFAYNNPPRFSDPDGKLPILPFVVIAIGLMLSSAPAVAPTGHSSDAPKIQQAYNNYSTEVGLSFLLGGTKAVASTYKSFKEIRTEARVGELTKERDALTNQSKELRAEGKQLEKSRSSLEKNVKEHEQKLKDYRNDPEKYDNKGILKDKTPELREKVVEGRSKALEKQIKKNQGELDKVEGQIKQNTQQVQNVNQQLQKVNDQLNIIR